jgi:regulator of protease activity HflC (stomatin/prohibitin superfamily)
MTSISKVEDPEPTGGRYRGVLVVLGALALVGALATVAAASILGNVMLDLTVALSLSAGAFASVALAQHERARSRERLVRETERDEKAETATPEEDDEREAQGEGALAETAKEDDTAEEEEEAQDEGEEVAGEEPETEVVAKEVAPKDGTSHTTPTPESPKSEEAGDAAKKPASQTAAHSKPALSPRRRRTPKPFSASLRVTTASVGLLALTLLAFADPSRGVQNPLSLGIAAAVLVAAAGLWVTAARYLGGVAPEELPEARGLANGARVLAWMFVVAAISMALVWGGQRTLLYAVHGALMAVSAGVCVGLDPFDRTSRRVGEAFSMDLAVWSILGSRANVAASILDAAERQLGIDLRSTWALTVVRRGVEPLAVGLVTAGWLSTSFTVVKGDEQAVVEHLGVPLPAPFGPGLHLHWPWPVDRVYRIPTLKVEMLAVGHEGEEEKGPENVLWAREHAANEYTLLLGNGRDLITVDAAVKFRISDAYAWRYNCQNPAVALRAIAYRAVMRSTVNRTLADALSENVATLTAEMRDVVQRDADDLGLGVEVVSFTVGGMHPPVAVASDYQAVVSAELGKVTAVVNAEAYRNQTVPAAEAATFAASNTARAQGAMALAEAAGEAWSFRTLESQVLPAPDEYRFRRRLEAFEAGLVAGHFTIIDRRIERDGGALWVTP